MNIAICYSANWADHVRVEVFAIQQTNPGARVYLISDTAGRLDLPGCVFVDVERLFQERIPTDQSITSRFTKYAHYRLLLPEVVPESRVLYIDADTIVDGSLADLWEMDLEGALVAGVRDIGILPQQLQAIGHQADDPYINAGVTLMDLDAIRAAGLYEVWLREINSRPYSCGDQDIINLTCRGRVKLVGNEWNSSLSTGFAAEPKVAHFAGPAHHKPWADGATPRNWEIWQKWDRQWRWIEEARAKVRAEIPGFTGTLCDGHECLACGAKAEDYSTLTYTHPIHCYPRIPKVIHTSWFGGARKPDLVQRCMDSWRRVMPDYRIQVWDESNMNPEAHAPRYALDAYRQRKWAFVTDWMRLRALYWEGGIYLDADVEIVKPLDRFLHHRAFTGYEADQWLLSATLGAEPHHPWIKMLLDHYLTAQFDGGRVPNTQTVTRLSQPWVKRVEDGYCHLREGVVIYPTDYFTPFDHQRLVPTPTERTHAIHHFAGSWTPRGAATQ